MYHPYAMLACFCLLIHALFPSSTCADDLDIESIRRTLASMAKAEIEKGVASVSIALVKDGKIVLKDAWGFSNAWAKTAASSETLYCTGSTFKAVTATMLLQLAEQGKLALDDPANQHLGKYKLVADKENKVTIRSLLDHTSGLVAGAATQDIWSRKLPLKLKEIPAKLTVITKPGRTWVYNNYAYAVAGLIVEQVSGKSYEEQVLQSVLKPLGIKTAGPVHPTPEMLQRMALPYFPNLEGKPQPTAFVHYDVYPAGDIYLTAEDMARFLAAHLNGGEFNGKRLLQKDSLRQAHQPNLRNYGLGWGISQSGKRKIISHGGGVPGFKTFMIGDLSTNVGAYVMSNSGDMNSMGNAAIKLLNGEKYVPPSMRKAVKLPATILQEYVGEYKLGSAKIEIQLESGQLSAKLTGQQFLPVYPQAKDKLFYKVVDAQYTVERNKEGKVSAIILHQNNREQKAIKVK